MKMAHFDDTGFTLIELMVVMAIIGIPAAIAIPNYAACRIRSFNASAQSDVRNLATAETKHQNGTPGSALTAMRR